MSVDNPAQWKLVPVEPTPEMLKVETWCFNRFYSPDEIWKAMLAAAPQPAQEPAAWMESPHGAIRANPLYRWKAPQSVAWSIPLYAGAAPTQAAPVAELVEALRKAEPVLEEVQTYTSSPSWSPSMTEECAAALATVRAALARYEKAK